MSLQLFIEMDSKNCCFFLFHHEISITAWWNSWKVNYHCYLDFFCDCRTGANQTETVLPLFMDPHVAMSKIHVYQTVWSSSLKPGLKHPPTRLSFSYEGKGT